MREVRSRCPRCGRVEHLRVDAWSGVPGEALDLPCKGGCERLAGRGRRSQVGPALLGLALVVAPLIGFAEAMSR